ncbi:MAG TPA: cyclic nucleotide-binding domain-containing protein [Azospirillaceae bacterium]|nr:cyclic nucleotide-binding domain-containing protein [Azospirillaceae bacterium]
MVQVEGLGRYLAEHPFLKDMSQDSRGIVVGCAANEVFKAGEVIFREGGPADKFYLIRNGAVAIEVHVPGHEALVVETLHDGDILGWSWLIAPYKWAFDARANEVTRVISLDGKCLRAKCEADPKLGYEIYKRFIPVMAHRLSETRHRLIETITDGD